MTNYPPSVLLPVKRIIAIGDLHGDYAATITALKKARLIDDKHNWIGSDTYVVQLGDQVDRGGRENDRTDEDSEFKIMHLFDRLHKQAKLFGGAVYSLIGNHELMNVLGDFTYTSRMGIRHFGGKKGRYEQFKPGGRIAVNMAKNRNVIMRIGDWIFVHGGITPRLAAKYKIVEVNNLMRNYLLGDVRLADGTEFKELFLNPGGLLWTRRYSEDKPDCKSLFASLDLLGAKRMVVAHTPQNKINSRCKDCVWRIDTGMSKAFGKRDKKNKNERIQILEILNNGKKINII